MRQTAGFRFHLYLCVKTYCVTTIVVCFIDPYCSMIAVQSFIVLLQCNHFTFVAQNVSLNGFKQNACCKVLFPFGISKNKEWVDILSGKGTLAVGSIYTLTSHITLKLLLMFYKYTILCPNTDKRQNLNFTVTLTIFQNCYFNM